MIFVSYAQNCEDVMLWRALRHVKAGFYIDVGANHPTDDSVTHAFYERGWSGINIEPLPEHIEQLRVARPRDVNLGVAVGAQNGEIELYETEVRGLATASPEVAAQHGRRGLAVKSRRVPQRRLDEICEEHESGPIHFLKIDVEGMEGEVLKGMDFARFRPWIVLIEATQPNTSDANASWEPLLVDAGYRSAYFDGLNRFYVAVEHQALQAAFSVPPNVFDDFVRLEQVRLKERLDLAQRQAQEAQSRAEAFQRMARDSHQAAVALEARARAAEACAQGLEQALHDVHISTSWRLTAPLRAVILAPRLLKAYLAARNAKPALVSGPPPVAQEEVSASRFDYAALPEVRRPPDAMRLAVPDTAPLVRVTGHIEGHYSLALVNRGLALALHKLAPGRIQFVPCHHQPYANPADLPSSQRGRLRAMIARSLPQDMPVLSIVHHYPLVTDAQPAAQRVAIFFWEESAVPAETVARINESFDALLVASSFVKRALINSGCRLPVFVIPMGVDQVLDPALAHQNPLLRLKHNVVQAIARRVGRDPADAALPLVEDLSPARGKRFRYLHVSSAFERKGVDLLLAAYFAQFTAADPVELYIKTFPNPHNTVRAQLACLQAERSDAPAVIIDEAALDEPAMATLYRSAQVLVLPTRGEGFNLPAAEAMALGIPVIITGYGAHADFCTRRAATLLPFRYARSQSHLKSPDACWIEPDAATLAERMREIFARVVDRDPRLEADRRAAADYMRATYRWRRSADCVARVAQWLDRKPTQQAAPVRVALLSPWATRCGIAEYTMGVAASLLASPAYRVDVYCDHRTSAEQAAAVRDTVCTPCWTTGDGGSVRAALQEIARKGYQVLVVQHQPALFRLDEAICELLEAIRASGCIVVVELHSTQQLLFEHRLTQRAIALMRKLDRVIVHQVDDLNHMLALGLADNLMLLPLLVVNPLPDLPELSRAATRQALGIGDDELVIAGFGFVFAHKGIDTLVRSVAPLAAATGRPVRLLCVNALPDAGSRQLLDDYQRLAQEAGVADKMIWLNDYQPIDESLRLLGAADFIVYPYKDTRESASAAATIGLATGRPVLVSPVHIFADLDRVTWRMDGHGVEDIVHAVTTLLADPERLRELAVRQREWLAHRSAGAIAARFEGFIHGLLANQFSPNATVEPEPEPEPAPPATGERQLLVDVSELYFRDARTGIQRVVRSILAELLSNPPAGHAVRPIYATPGQPYRHTGKFGGDAARPLAEGLDETPIAVGWGDIFLGLDLSAHLFPAIEPQLRQFRSAGARIHFVIYDLIPLRYPQYCDEPLTVAFTEWMRGLARHADALHCISDAVAEDVRAWLYHHSKTLPLPEVHHFHLGADIDNSSPTSGLPADAEELLGRLTGEGRTFLSVGTIEPRKGQGQILDAFELLWQEGLAVRLVLIGKAGWKMEGFIDRLREHPERGKRLFWLEGVSDEYLERVYAASHCLIAASVTEGFGLPLIEAARRDLPIIARDIPVFREVAGEHAWYFSGERGRDLALAIQTWLMLEAKGEAPASSGMRYLTWRDSTGALLANVLPMRDARGLSA